MIEWTIVRLFLTTYWKPLAIGVLVLASWGGLAYWGHTKYVAGRAEGIKIAEVAKTALAKEKLAHEHDRTEWEATALSVKQANDAEVKRLNGIIKAKETKISTLQANLKRKVETANVQIIKAFHPTDVIVVPHNFSLFYNAAVQHHHSATGLAGSEKGSQESGYSISPTFDTYDAVAFTQRIVGNIEKYNEEMLVCDGLKELIKENQDGQGTNSQ